MKRELIACGVLIFIISFSVFHVKSTQEKMAELISNIETVENLVMEGKIDEGKKALETGFNHFQSFIKYFELTHRQEELANAYLGYFTILADIDKGELTMGSILSQKNLLYYLAESERPSLGAIF